MKGRGLVRVRGQENHDKLVSAVIKFLIKKCNASPLEICTEVPFYVGKAAKTYIDIVYKDSLFECETSKNCISGRKMNDLQELNKFFILVIPDKAKMHLNQRLSLF